MDELELAYISIETLKAQVNNLTLENAALRRALNKTERTFCEKGSLEFDDDEENTGCKWGGNGH